MENLDLESVDAEFETNSHCTFKFDWFEGPIGLLSQLIKEKNMDVDSVKLADLTGRYLEYMQELEKVDMEDTTSFLDVLSTLLLIKSKSLLPKDEVLMDEDGEIDEETRLKMQIKEYELFKQAGADLHEIENVDRLYKQPDKSAGDTRIVFNQFNLDKLLDAFAFILMRTKDKENPSEKKINRDRWTVADKIAFLTNLLKDNKEINFFSLFDETYSKLEVITVFMAILELLKFQKIEVVQAERYADILIKRKEEEPNEP